MVKLGVPDSHVMILFFLSILWRYQMKSLRTTRRFSSCSTRCFANMQCIPILYICMLQYVRERCNMLQYCNCNICWQGVLDAASVLFCCQLLCNQAIWRRFRLSPQLIAVKNSTAQVISKTRTAMEPCQPKNWVRSWDHLVRRHSLPFSKIKL